MSQEYPSEIDDLLNTFHHAAAVAHFDTYFGCFSAEGRFIGTDAEENWMISEFQEYARPHFAGSSAWVYNPISGTRKCKCFSPNMATFDELLISPSLKCKLRGSGVIVYDSNLSKWLILSYHLSFPIPDEKVPDVTAAVGSYRIKNDDRLLRQREDEAARAAAAFLDELGLEDEQTNKTTTQTSKKKKKKKK